MNTIEKIKYEIENLSNNDFIEFRKWFTEYDAKIWDDQIERDIEEGKLDKMVFSSVRSEPLIDLIG